MSPLAHENEPFNLAAAAVILIITIVIIIIVIIIIIIIIICNNNNLTGMRRLINFVRETLKLMFPVDFRNAYLLRPNSIYSR